MNLKEWLKTNRYSNKAFAQMCGVSDAMMSQVANGRRPPGRNLAERISAKTLELRNSEGTKGEVAVEELRAEAKDA